jgi:serine/threonine-protein kinase
MARVKQSDVGPRSIELGAGRHLTLLDVLGKGSGATVYRGMLVSDVGVTAPVERPVAVKLLSSLASDDCEAVFAAVLAMTRRLAVISHPNVVQVSECGVWRGRPFVVQELVQGVSLATLSAAFRAKTQRLPLDVALFIGAEVAEALAGARVSRDARGAQLGIVHQALSAREVLLSCRGEVKVGDFEMSAARAGGSSVRSLGGVAGRAQMMAPEVAQGREADARADVFSLGILLRELLLGPRFPEDLSNADAIRLAREGYIRPLTFQPQLPHGLMGIIGRAVEIDPELRYPNPCAMAFDLRREVFSMGVGDGRYFLRRVLEREWVQRAEEVTAEHGLLRARALARQARAQGLDLEEPLDEDDYTGVISFK